MSDNSATSFTTRIFAVDAMASRVVTPIPCGSEEELSGEEPDFLVLPHDNEDDDGIAVFTSFLDVEISNASIRSPHHEIYASISRPLPTNSNLVFGYDISQFCVQQDGVDCCESDLLELAAKIMPVSVSECVWVDLDDDSDADDQLLSPFLNKCLSGSEWSCVSSCSDMSISSAGSCGDMSISSNESASALDDEGESSSFPSMGSISSYDIDIPKHIIAHQSAGDDDDEDELRLDLKLNEEYTQPFSKMQNDSLDRMEQAVCFGREDACYDVDNFNFIM